MISPVMHCVSADSSAKSATSTTSTVSSTSSLSSSGLIDVWGIKGHLSESHQAALNSFLASVPPTDLNKVKFRCEPIENAALRFLRARNFDLSAAKTLLQEAIHKKEKDYLVAVYASTSDPDKLLHCDLNALKKFYPHEMPGIRVRENGRSHEEDRTPEEQRNERKEKNRAADNEVRYYDKWNRPILFEASGKIDFSAIHQITSTEHLIHYHFYCMETVLNSLFEKALSAASSPSSLSGKEADVEEDSASSSNKENQSDSNINQSSARSDTSNGTMKSPSQPSSVTDDPPQLFSTCVIVDLAGLSAHQMSGKALEHLKSMISLDNVVYPEVLGKMFIVNAPWLAGKMALVSLSVSLMFLSS
jgi:hypothetical protein